jgi:hypothetical protein
LQNIGGSQAQVSECGDGFIRHDSRAEAACASRSKRLRACESGANPSGRNFKARSGAAWCPLLYRRHPYHRRRAFEDAVVGDCATDQRLRIGHLSLILGRGRRQVNEPRIQAAIKVL